MEIGYKRIFERMMIKTLRQSAEFSSATQNAMAPEFRGKQGTKCLNTRFPRPTLLCAGVSVKEKNIKKNKKKSIT